MSYIKRQIEDECTKIAQETNLPWGFVIAIFNHFEPVSYFAWKELALCEAKYRGMV